MFNRLSTGRSLQPSLKTTGEKIETTRKQQKKKREFEESMYDYDSESTDLISDNDMPPVYSAGKNRQRLFSKGK